MRHTFTLDSIHKTYISQISLFTLRKNAQPQVKKALSGVSITLTPGLYGLLGPNGAGKSTLIHIITGTLAPDSGEVLWCGKPASGIAFRRILGYMPQQQGLYDSYTGRRFLAYMAALKEIPRKAVAAEVDRVAAAVNLTAELDKRLSAYSGGMKQRLLLASALLGDPKLLILDEATTGLDPVVRDEVLDLFLEFIQDEDCSIFFSSHITSDIQKIADYVILIHQGKIIFEEQKDNLVYNYGVAKCGKEKFAQLSADDYIIHRTTNMSVECLVHDKDAFKRKYKNIIVDNATLEDIMLFYVKGGTSCED